MKRPSSGEAELVESVTSWRYREVGETDLGDREELNATELDERIRCALCRLDADFFDSLATACREIKKPKVSPHEKSLWALARAFETFKRSNPKRLGKLFLYSLAPEDRPTWGEVVEVARTKFELPHHSKKTMQRLRRELGTVAIHLPDATRGKAKKRGQKKIF
jgi:hypothetical protein